MEKSHFPGYNTCKACNTLISLKEIHEHKMVCRGQSSVIQIVETKLCPFCNKQIHVRELQDHVVKCNEQQTLSSPSSEKKSIISNKSPNDLSSHRRSNKDNRDTDEDDETGYQTPPTETPPLQV